MIDVADLLLWPPLAATGATEADAAALAELERGVVAFLQTQTGRYFGPPELVSEFAEGAGISRLWLRDHATHDPEASGPDEVVSVEERNVPGADPTLIGNYELRQADRESLLVRLGGDVWLMDFEYEVLYWRGYQVGEEPADIRALVMDLVTARWALRESFGLKSETIGGYSYTRFGPEDLEACGVGSYTLDAWRRPILV